MTNESNIDNKYVKSLLEQEVSTWTEKQSHTN